MRKLEDGTPGFRAYAYEEKGVVRVNDWSALKLKMQRQWGKGS
jgi:hypothetical protein